jgi:hypothetical protein
MLPWRTVDPQNNKILFRKKENGASYKNKNVKQISSPCQVLLRTDFLVPFHYDDRLSCLFQVGQCFVPDHEKPGSRCRLSKAHN